MSMTPNAAAGIVATVLRVESATAYAPTDPAYGLIVIPDETWLGTAYVEYVRVDGLASRGYAENVELHTTEGTYQASEDDTPAGNVAARILDALNAVVMAGA
jgi:hypothetical protein